MPPLWGHLFSWMPRGLYPGGASSPQKQVGCAMWCHQLWAGTEQVSTVCLVFGERGVLCLCRSLLRSPGQLAASPVSGPRSQSRGPVLAGLILSGMCGLRTGSLRWHSHTGLCKAGVCPGGVQVERRHVPCLFQLVSGWQWSWGVGRRDEGQAPRPGLGFGAQVRRSGQWSPGDTEQGPTGREQQA